MIDARARSIGEPIGLASIDLQGALAVDPRPLGEERALGERKHLHGEADVDRELQRQSLPVVAHIVRAPELLE
jgi:hypothetical protein